MNAYYLLNIPASIVPDQKIISFENTHLTYRQLEENTQALAAGFISLGVGKGDRIGFISTNCPEMLETFFAAFHLGAIIVPLNYRAKQEELDFMIKDSGIKVLVFEERYADLLTPILASHSIIAICIGEQEQSGKSYHDLVAKTSKPCDETEFVEEGELAVLLYTSGTTSKPKGVMITHGQLTNYVMSHSEAADGSDQGASIICAPNYHIAGATSLLNGIFGGRRLILMRQFEAAGWLAAIANEKATHAFLVPTMLKQVIDHPNFFSIDLSSLKSLSYGAAPMPLPVIRRAIEMFPEHTEFANAFGLTETTSTVCVLGPEDHKLNGTQEEIEKKLIRLSSVGKPLPAVEIMIKDENGNPVGKNVTGNIFIRTERTMRGYWKREDASDETLVDGWVNTKDMGWLDEEGYLFLSGRSSDMIIRGGENISPSEIENVILEHPEISDAAVIGTESLDWGEEVTAIIVPINLEQPPAKEEIITLCRKHLASYKCPSEIIFTSELPRTSTGKILKRKLREQYDCDSIAK